MNIYLMRHAKTYWNEEERMQGWKDSSLSPAGIEEARSLSREMAHLPLDKIYTSDLGRAVESAKILRGERDIPIILTEDLRELSVGEWEGQIFYEVRKGDAERFNRYFDDPESHELPGAETYYDLQRRIRSFLETLKREEAENILVVGHGVSIQAIINEVENIPLANFWHRPLVKGSKITHLQYEAGHFHLLKEAERIETQSY